MTETKKKIKLLISLGIDPGFETRVKLVGYWEKDVLSYLTAPDGVEYKVVCKVKLTPVNDKVINEFDTSILIKDTASAD